MLVGRLMAVHGMEWQGMTWPGLAWHGMAQCVMAGEQCVHGSS